MPFIKRGESPPHPAGNPATAGEADKRAPDLTAADAEERWRAARAFGGRAEAVPALATALKDEQVPRVREAMMTALMRVGDVASVTALVPYLRSQDAAIRSSAIDSLQCLPDIIVPFLTQLLRDSDSDVRILAAELARNLPPDQATQILCTLIEHEQHPNVCAAAIEVLTEVGTAAALPVLNTCVQRFSTTPFLPFAASIAIDRISGAKN